MKEIIAKEGMYLTQVAEVENRVFVTALKGVNINEADWRDATLEEKLRNEGVPAADAEKLGAPSYENLMRFVIDNVDGVVVGSESADMSLVEYARQSGKKVLDYQSPEDGDFYDNYDRFYEELF